jgi:hypothetical protein
VAVRYVHGGRIPPRAAGNRDQQAPMGRKARRGFQGPMEPLAPRATRGIPGTPVLRVLRGSRAYPALPEARGLKASRGYRDRKGRRVSRDRPVPREAVPRS